MESQIYLKEALLWPEALIQPRLGRTGTGRGVCVWGGGDGELQRGAEIQLYNGPIAS